MPPQRNTTSTSKANNAKTPFKPKPPRPAAERLPKLYRGLTDQINEGHLANAKKTCRKILNLDSTSTAAFQTLLFLHLDTDDYASALALLDSPPTSSPLDFEKAYCLYRLHREKESLEVLTKLGSSGRKQQHLEAQIRYRLGEYQKAQEIYDGLLASSNSSSAEYPDIIENLTATSAHIDFESHGYSSYLHAPPPADLSGAASAHVPTEADLETYVPSLPTGWATGGVEGVKKAAAAAPAKTVKTEQTASKKRKHKLPKGASDSKPFSGDPDRWLPLRQRASYVAAMSKKKGQNLSMGTGMTQGSTTQAAASGGAGGGGKKKKGKK